MIEDLMRAFAFNQLHAFCAAGGAENGQTERARHLHRCDANASAGSMNQNRFGAVRLRFVMDGMVRRGIRDKDASALREGDATGQQKNLRLGRERVFGVGAGKTFRDVDAVAGFYFFHAIADGVDDACSIGSGRVGKRWDYSVVARAGVSIGGIDTGGVDFYQYLSGGGLGCGDVLELENFRTAELTNENGFHCKLRKWKLGIEKQNKPESKKPNCD